MLAAPRGFPAPSGPAAHLISGLLAAPPDLRPPRGQARVLKPGQDPSLRINVARNSPSSISNVEFTSLELQRFETVFKTDRVKLRATYVWLGPCRRPLAPQPCPLASSGPSGAHHTGGAWSLMRGSARRLVVRPCPAAAHGHCGQARVLKPGQDPSLRINVARNSPSSISNVEFTSLELQRFETFFKTDRVKLRATYVWLGPCRCLRALGAAPWPLDS